MGEVLGLLQDIKLAIKQLELWGFIVICEGIAYPEQAIPLTAMISLAFSGSLWLHRMIVLEIFGTPRRLAIYILYIPLGLSTIVLGTAIVHLITVGDYLRCLVILCGIGITLIPSVIEIY